MTQPAPIACTLTTADLATQRDRWQQLARSSLVERAETRDGVRLSFREGAGIEEELRALVEIERDCCAWAEWTVQAGEEQVVLDVRATGEGVAALRHMFTSLQAG